MRTDSGKKLLAIGTEDFEELRKTGRYYVDKTGLISELLHSPAKVTLFTRPRRFGKTLNMSMLKCFFEIGGNPVIFGGLAVSKETELCESYMAKFPVISLSLKGVSAGNYQGARGMLCSEIGFEAMRFSFLESSGRLTEQEKDSYRQLVRLGQPGEPQFIMSDEVLVNGVRILSSLLEKHYGQKAILLIDEYDVPLQKAFLGGYYDEMVQLVRSMFSQALKTNPSLKFAVLTGCLRISKESIFTGMNNLKVFSIADVSFDEYFGFTDAEVREMMGYYGLADSYEQAKNWYDGFHFGGCDVYCPWDVVNYCYDRWVDPKVRPQNYWANSSDNDAVAEFVKRLDASVAAKELEQLVAGEAVMKEIHQELTYREMYDSIENLWSLLYMTGYLTKRGETEDEKLSLVIPNMEIRGIFKRQIMDLFKERVAADGAMVREFCDALKCGDADTAEELFRQYLKKTVSIRDTFARRDLKENFYHGILLGILSFKGNWYVTSNEETGDGYGDVLIETEDDDLGIVIEVKYARDGDLDKGVQMALRQIAERHYDEKLLDDGVAKVLRYGVACYKKRCKVALGD